MTGPVARRYARAIFSLSAADETLEETGRQLAALASVFHDGELSAIAESADLDRKRKGEVAVRVAERAGASGTVRNFIGLLAERDRLRFLGSISEEFSRLLDRASGRVRAKIRTPMPLAEESVREIRELFGKRTGKSVLTDVQQAPELLGGVVVEIAGRVYDGSLRTQIERLRAALSG